MTTEQVLEQQVEALEKLLQLKQAVIDELEAKVQRLQVPAPISIPSVWTVPNWQCTDGNPHVYPQTWGGTGSVPCQKCGVYPQTWGGTGITIGGGVLGGQIGINQQPQGQGSNTGIITVTNTGGNSNLTVLPNGSTAVQTTGYLQPVDENSNNNNFCSVIPLHIAAK